MPLHPLQDSSPGLTRRQVAGTLAALGVAGAIPRARAQANEPFTPADLAHAHGLRERGLQDTQAYALVESLVTEVGARAAGSPNDARAVQWALARLRQLGFADVRAEPVPDADLIARLHGRGLVPQLHVGGPLGHARFLRNLSAGCCGAPAPAHPRERRGACERSHAASGRATGPAGNGP